MMTQRFTDAELAEMRAFYEEHGALHIPNLVDPAKAQEILDFADQMAAQADEPIPAGSPVSYGRGIGRMTIRYLWKDKPLINEFLLDGDLGRTVAGIVGAKQLRFWFDLTFMHNGTDDGSAGEGTAWHHDIAAFGFKGEQLPSLWMALTKATLENSRLEFIDGSHKTVPGYYRPPTNNPSAWDGFLEIPDFDAKLESGEEKILAWDCGPGDALLIHPYTIHGARGNAGGMTGGRRVAITTRWLGDDVRWLPTNNVTGTLPGLKESNLAVGGRPKGEWFPLVHDTIGKPVERAV